MIYEQVIRGSDIRHGGRAMREEAFRFGRAGHLAGIVGLPSATDNEVGVIVLNAGMVHRIGPFRLSVEMTRRLNACGYPTLRFDLSTIGDSSSSGESQTRKQQVCADVDDAMNLLQGQGGCTRFVLIGLCSGAQNAHTVACISDRVAGVVFLDGYAYRTLGYRIRHYLPRLLDMERWHRALTRRSSPSVLPGVEPVFGVPPLPQKEVRTDFSKMLDRGLKLLLIYTGGISTHFNHERQFRECFGRVVTRPGISTRYVGEADHTYILAGDRIRMFTHIERWLGQNFPVEFSGTPS